MVIGLTWQSAPSTASCTYQPGGHLRLELALLNSVNDAPSDSRKRYWPLSVLIVRGPTTCRCVDIPNKSFRMEEISNSGSFPAALF